MLSHCLERQQFAKRENSHPAEGRHRSTKQQHPLFGPRQFSERPSSCYFQVLTNKYRIETEHEYECHFEQKCWLTEKVRTRLPKQPAAAEDAHADSHPHPTVPEAQKGARERLAPPQQPAKPLTICHDDAE